MSYHTRSLSSHVRAPSGVGPSAAQSPALVARIEEKKAELAHLKELKELSAAVANQMESLEQKLSTLSDGTEAIAAVVGNWHNVLRAINMASSKLAKAPGDSKNEPDDSPPLPQTLVRIPTEHAPNVHAQAEAAEAAEAEAAANESAMST